MQSFQESENKNSVIARQAQPQQAPQTSEIGPIQSPGKPGLPTWAWLAISGLLGLLLILVALLLQNQRGTSRDYGALALQYVQPYPKLPNWPEGSTLPTNLIEGLNAFERRNFEQAAGALAQVSTQSPHYRISQYYLGVSLLALRRFQSASEALQFAADTPDWQAREPALYYLGVSLIGQGLPDAACTWLNPDSYHLNNWYGPAVRELYGRFCP